MTPTRTPTDRPRSVLLADAAICAAFGLLLAAGAGPLAGLLELPRALLFYAGLVLFPTAGFMAWVATRAVDSAAAVWTVVAGNLAWVAASFGILLAGAVAPNALGTLFVCAQAVCVLGLAALEARGAIEGRSLAGVA